MRKALNYLIWLQWSTITSYDRQVVIVNWKFHWTVENCIADQTKSISLPLFHKEDLKQNIEICSRSRIKNFAHRSIDIAKFYIAQKMYLTFLGVKYSFASSVLIWPWYAPIPWEEQTKNCADYVSHKNIPKYIPILNREFWGPMSVFFVFLLP